MSPPDDLSPLEQHRKIRMEHQQARADLMQTLSSTFKILERVRCFRFDHQLCETPAEDDPQG